MLKVTVTPFYPSVEGEEWRTDEEVLLRHVNHLSFEYFGSEEGQDDPHWQDDWQGRTQLPQLIKIKIQAGAQNFWPQLVVDLKASASALGAVAGSQDNEESDSGNEEKLLDKGGSEDARSME